jgi:hypothetical protein
MSSVHNCLTYRCSRKEEEDDEEEEEEKNTNVNGNGNTIFPNRCLSQSSLGRQQMIQLETFFFLFFFFFFFRFFFVYVFSKLYRLLTTMILSIFHTYISTLLFVVCRCRQHYYRYYSCRCTPVSSLVS